MKFRVEVFKDNSWKRFSSYREGIDAIRKAQRLCLRGEEVRVVHSGNTIFYDKGDK